MSNINIAVFRPGVIANGTAFEAQALIYKYIQREYGWKFTIIKGEKDNFYDKELKTISIPTSSYKTLPKVPIPINLIKYRTYVINKLEGYDLIISSDPTIYTQGSLAANAARKFNIPLVFDASVTTMNSSNSLFWKITKGFSMKSMKHSKVIWLTVPKVGERFRDLGLSDDIYSKQFKILGHPVNMEFYKPISEKSNDEKIIILTVGRLVMEKGIHYIIQSVAPLIRENKNIILRIIGKGESKQFLINVAKDEGILENIEIIDPVPHSQLPLLYNEAHIFVTHPVSISKWEEFFGLANIEAMACGLPVVTTNCGGIPHVFRVKDVAFLTEERNVVELTEKLKGLIYNSSLRKEISSRGISYIEKNYSLTIIGEKYKNTLDQLLTKN